MSIVISRRSVLVWIASLPITACTQVPKPEIDANPLSRPETTIIASAESAVVAPYAPAVVQPEMDYAQIYAAVSDEGYSIPAIDHTAIKRDYLRQVVDYATAESPYSIVIDTEKRFLYWVLPEGKAIRYGVGLGAAGRSWKGRAVVQWKRKWPRWTVPDAMVARQPHLKKYGVEAGGMDPGLDNPLGSRAMYIYQDGKDTLYRIHGSPQWRSIGKNASSGCVRMLQQDVIDLYGRVKGKTPLLVL